MTDPTSLAWRKASSSNGNGGDCVEVADLPGGGWLVRDTKDRTRPPLHCTDAAWHAFVEGVRAGEFE